MVKRPYPPGQRGKRRLGGPTEYGLLLAEKQKLKTWYNLKERQLKRYVKKALAMRGKVEDIGKYLLNSLEMRLDNVVFRSGFAKSRSQARQLVSHSFFLVNEEPVNIPSFSLKVGDEISMKPQKMKKKYVENLKDFLKKYTPPSHLKLDPEKLKVKIISEPKVEEILLPVDLYSVFEFYSK